MHRLTNILIVYHWTHYPLRRTLLDHLYSFERCSGARCYYLNLAFRKLPKWMSRIQFDLVVFDKHFLEVRFRPRQFQALLESIRPIRNWAAVKIAIPQDEFVDTRALCDFVTDFGLNAVFSVAPESQWPLLYEGVDFSRVRFFRILTGYLDEGFVDRMRRFQENQTGRDIDVGYRVIAAPWLGYIGARKIQLAEAAQTATKRLGLAADISTHQRDTLFGDDWYRFLLRSKCVLGVEGGASVMDPDGRIRETTARYIREHPDARFEEIRDACYPGCDGRINVLALSPRHFEAVATRTCQILIEGEYNGILKPGIHYIPIKTDLSDMDEALEAAKNEDLRAELTQNAYRDIVETRNYSYRGFVSFVIEQSLSGRVGRRRDTNSHAALSSWCALLDKCSWFAVIVFGAARLWGYRALCAVFSKRRVQSVYWGVRRMAN